MCPAPRRPQNRGLEPNLHTHPKGFRWKNPRTGKYHYLGKAVSRKDANEAARALNLKFARKTSIFDRVAAQESESLRAVIETHRKEYLANQRVSDSTRKNRGYIIGKIAASELASCDVSSINTRDVVQYLKSLPTDSMRQQYRTQLIAVFKTAIKEGLIDRNPATDSEAPYVERKRDRLTIEGFQAIHALAEPWLQNLMDLIRLTLQRPDDLVSLRWDAVVGSQLRIVQGKTGAKLAIEIRPELRALLARCRDDVVSPYIIHRIPERIKSRDQRSKKRDHHTQVFRSKASRAFTAQVRRCEYFQGQETPPTLYECKSLGIALLRQQGWSKEQVQRLAGHRSVRMTEHYAKGHEAPFDIVGVGPAEDLSVTEALP